MNFPAFSVITYYGNFHPHQQDCTNTTHHSCWQLILVHFQRREDAFLVVQNHRLHVTEHILSWIQLIFHISCSLVHIQVLHEYY